MTTLLRDDLRHVVSHLPHDVRDLLQNTPGRFFVAGGFIRAKVAREAPSDVDVFGPDPQVLFDAATSFVHERNGTLYETGNAYTVLSRGRIPVQFIHRWTYTDPQRILEQFDFTVCQAVVWYEGGEWRSLCSRRFYQDLAARRLHYTAPEREEDAGGSMLRVVKYLGRGYSISPESLAKVIARLACAVRWDELPTDDDRELAASRVIRGLLREVDPLTIVDGVEVRDDPDDEDMADESVDEPA